MSRWSTNGLMQVFVEGLGEQVVGFPCDIGIPVAPGYVPK